jgi:polyhydroxybutyrate depolymerase
MVVPVPPRGGGRKACGLAKGYFGVSQFSELGGNGVTATDRARVELKQNRKKPGGPQRSLPAFAFVLALLFVALSAAALPGETLTWQGRERTYHVFRPIGIAAGTRVPLVLALHGGGGTGLGMDGLTRGTLRKEAARRGWLLVCPDGIAKGWNDGRPLVGVRDRARAGVDDVGFLSALIDRMIAEEHADPGRVYVTGISNGGFMSLRLAVDLAERIAAVAAVSASVTKVLENSRPAKPVAVLLFNGTADPLVPYGGGEVSVLGRPRGEVLSTPAAVAWWAARDGCSGASAVRALPDRDPDDGTRVTVEAHDRCEEGTTVVLYRVEGGGHGWPGGRQYFPRFIVGRVTHDVDGTRAIFDFFARHTR